MSAIGAMPPHLPNELLDIVAPYIENGDRTSFLQTSKQFRECGELAYYTHVDMSKYNPYRPPPHGHPILGFYRTLVGRSDLAVKVKSLAISPTEQIIEFGMRTLPVASVVASTSACVPMNLMEMDLVGVILHAP